MTTPMFQLPPGATCELDGCGKILEGEVVRDARGYYFCGAHKAELRTCRFCGRGFVPGAATKGDACSQCTRRGVSSTRDAEARFQRAIFWFERNGLRFATPLPSIELNETLPRPTMLGFTEKIQAGHGWLKARTDTPRIVMRNALSPEMFDVVVSHELGHVWLTAQNVPLSEQMEEGICTWLSHRYASSQGTPTALWLARQIEAQTDPVYGTGFRRFSQLAGKASPADLPRILQSHRTTLQH
jgi:hypothetical protein